MSATKDYGRLFNFSAGPAVMPVSVLERMRDELLCLPGVGSSILEISHRSKAFDAILDRTIDDLKQLLGIPAGYSVLFLQGGSRLQFSMVPMNLLRDSGRTAQYVITGTWGKSALVEAVKEGKTEVLWDGKGGNYSQLPRWSDVKVSPEAAYLHVTSNETIQGIQFHDDPTGVAAPVVSDMSSDFLSRPVDVSQYGLIYACAQKNAGPAGVTVVIIRDDLLARGAESMPGYLLYRNHAEGKSCYNTPPTFAIYAMGLIVRWLLDDIGGLGKMAEANRSKAALLYDAIDRFPAFYQGHAEKSVRSMMNVTFRLPNEELEGAFLSEAKKAGCTDLKGHRSVGGIRASIYNAMPREGVETLASLMTSFAERHG
ncbi:MAG TPA: 3-phosphoserine/phosphohydroxythreonine transaminase [Planctomycetaceae bacterium]|nr:3-phosphoserine/phosphohydroxythreonine transaminase [Planctomycetaceae bacterium]HRF02787.1 3-phosphoserine/phosphohydroxythreonine transaminase [Pirellulaceae bacterium]